MLLVNMIRRNAWQMCDSAETVNNFATVMIRTVRRMHTGTHFWRKKRCSADTATSTEKVSSSSISVYASTSPKQRRTSVCQTVLVLAV